MLHPEQTNEILRYIFPYLRTASIYASVIQKRIGAQPDKESENNFFGAALSDADLSVQSFIEVALLAQYPQIKFRGEEYEKSVNTKYFDSTNFGADDELLALLDPIDGTRFYLDQHNNYQTIFCLVTPKTFEGAIAISPAQNRIFYAVRSQGAFVGNLSESLSSCRKLALRSDTGKIILGVEDSDRVDLSKLGAKYVLEDYVKLYSPTKISPIPNDLLCGRYDALLLGGALLHDNATIAFIAQEAGALVTDFKGQPLTEPRTCPDFRYKQLLVANSPEVQKEILPALAFYAP